MTEQEIISYLKENRKKGVGLAFMPSEVRKWCIKHRDEKIFYIVDEGEWVIEEPPVMCHPDNIYCLDADYESKQEFKPDWQEFDIDENGYFYYEGKEYYYRDDVAFEKRYSYIFKGFGGWLYNDGKGYEFWSIFPRVIDDDGNFLCVIRTDSYKEVKPAYPTKIRFWRYKE